MNVHCENPLDVAVCLKCLTINNGKQKKKARISARNSSLSEKATRSQKQKTQYNTAPLRMILKSPRKYFSRSAGGGQEFFQKPQVILLQVMGASKLGSRGVTKTATT